MANKLLRTVKPYLEVATTVNGLDYTVTGTGVVVPEAAVDDIVAAAAAVGVQVAATDSDEPLSRSPRKPIRHPGSLVHYAGELVQVRKGLVLADGTEISDVQLKALLALLD